MMNADSAAAEFEFGPIQLLIVEFEGDRPDPAALAALRDLGDGDAVRLVDIVVAVRLVDGELRVHELEDMPVDLANAVDLAAEGLIGEEDIADAAEGLQPGFGVALVAMEMRWAAHLSSTLAAVGGHVAHIALIPGPVVNELVHAGLMASTNGQD